MAPTQADPEVFFPGLQKCFSGEHQLLSWKAVYNALCDPDTVHESLKFKSFLVSADSIAILSRPLKPFDGPSQAAKDKFETKTAAINVTPSSTKYYDIEDIKKDTLWLSDLTKIDEVSALRIVVLEWQTRPALQLLGGFTEEEVISVQDASGASNLGTSTFWANSSILAAPVASSAQPSTLFNSDAQRHLRLLETYLWERVYILRTSQIMTCRAASEELRQEVRFGKGRKTDGDIDAIAEVVIKAQQSGWKEPPSDCNFLIECIDALQSRLTGIDTGSDWTVPEGIQADLEQTWSLCQAVEIAHILQLMFAHIDLFMPKMPPVAMILAWYRFMRQCAFFANIQFPFSVQEPLLLPIQLLSSSVSLALLKLHHAVDYLESEEPVENPASIYIFNTACLREITEIFIEVAKEEKRSGAASPAGPAVFAWGIIAFSMRNEVARIVGFGDEDRQTAQEDYPTHDPQPEQTPMQDALNAIEDETLVSDPSFGTKSPIQFLAEHSARTNIFELIERLAQMTVFFLGFSVDEIIANRNRLLLLGLIRASVRTELVRYSPEVIKATLAVLVGRRRFWDWVDSDCRTPEDPVVQAFSRDDEVMLPMILEEAQCRYPYEIAAFLKFLSAMTLGGPYQSGVPPVGEMLRRTTRFTQTMPPDFTGYNSIREEENANFISLVADLDLFSTGKTTKLLGSRRRERDLTAFDEGDYMYIPAGTVGNVVDDSATPHIATWNYPHSALGYLVTLLSTFMVGSNCVEYASQQPTSMENATEIIELLADLLTFSVRSSVGEKMGCSQDLLEAMNIGADRTRDTVSVVFAIFEQEMQRQCEQPGVEGSLELLVNCTHFVYIMVSISPNRVWPWLARSRLLENDGSGGSLATILVGSEMVAGRYDFLIGCIRLFEALIEDAVAQCVTRKGTSKAVTRFGSVPTPGSGTSEKTMSNSLLTFGRTLTGIFESSLSWKYERIADKLEINTRLAGTFDTILRYAYGFDDTSSLPSKLTSLLGPVAEYLADLFLSTSTNDLPTNPILNSFVSAADEPLRPIPTSANELLFRQTRTALSFSNTLIRVGMLQDRPCSHLEQQLFKAAPLLARLYAMNEAYKSPVVLLLESLVRTAARADGEPPSLLGHLGPETAKSFLMILSTLDQPLETGAIEVDIWNLLSAVVSCKQQWFAIYLLTGNTPRESLRVKQGETASSQLRWKTLFTFALDRLSDIDVTKPRRTIAMLEFITLAQNNWPWAMNDLRKHKKFIAGLVTYLKGLKQADVKAEGEIIDKCNENRIAALIAETLAMYLHTSRQLNNYSSLTEIVPNLTYFQNCGVSVPSYNSSLHANLKKNFEARFQGCSLASFKRTQISPAEFGRNYFYDLGFAEKVLGFDSSWHGYRNQGFFDEFVRANINLSLVESQILLLKSWKLLAAELSNAVKRDDRLPKSLISVAKDCLIANTQSNLPQALFGRLVMLRVDFAFTLIQKLVEVKSNDESARGLFSVVWGAIRATRFDFERAFIGDGADYYRVMLKILFLSLQFHLLQSANGTSDDFRTSFRASVSIKPTETDAISQQLLEILTEVVAKGFRSLANQIHEDAKSCSPTDFVLLTGILQTILRIPEMQVHHSQAALIFSNNNTSRYAVSLFSWSDQLAIDRDPIYGELSILFLLELSSMRVMAETLAVEGVLARLNTANLMNYYRRPSGMGPFDDPPRLFSIWTRGILPLCLNLLDAVGAPVAAEIASFLNQFPAQLARASACLNSRVVPTIANPNVGHITLGMASETHSLALIVLVLERLSSSSDAVGIIPTELPQLAWEKAAVKEDVEGWLQGRRGLRDRIVPTNEREVELARMKAESEDAENRLEERVVAELRSALGCLVD
ncbi:hypothetical protein K432DRAFT_428911 [Lepidopterella palustris CBS 459.81]|uniref:Nucleoporin NUP188 n=1 Tax=Lepidopterella palustris CBS 459.81 TaxID=1314670 RepID=A0A8E2E2H8_9PEZI|nr:hypothetical protein K432DRAFT_428911 [Lepidopterella palustris CBS 459.81]